MAPRARGSLTATSANAENLSSGIAPIWSAIRNRRPFSSTIRVTWCPLPLPLAGTSTAVPGITLAAAPWIPASSLS